MMIKDKYVDFKGYFKIECLDKDNNVKDCYEDNNYIMRCARRTVAEMFSNKKNTGLNKLVLGTCGGIETEFIPITEDNGFKRERTHLYSEPIEAGLGDIVKLYQYEIVSVKGLGEFRFINPTPEEPETIEITSETLENTDIFNQIKSYTYIFKIQNPESAKKPDGVKNYAASLNNNCTIYLNEIDNDFSDLENTTVTHVFEIGMSEANGQHKSSEEGYSENVSLFNEAGMYFNNRLFCSKCFSAKVKDASTKVRITWKIVF